MILNIITNEPNVVLQNLNVFWGKEWTIADLGEVAKGIHEYSMTPKGEAKVLSVENLLELGIAPYNIRVY